MGLKWFYKKIRPYILSEIENDFDLKVWVDAQTTADVNYKMGYKRGNEEAKEQWENQVDRRVKDKFSEINFLVNPNHVFQQMNGVTYLGLEPISKKDATQLREEAKNLQGMKLWSIFQNMIRNMALDSGFKKSTEWKQTESFKNMVYNLDILDSTVKSMANMNVDAIPDKVGQ